MRVLGRTTAREKVGAFLIEMASRCSDGAAEVVLLPMPPYDTADYLAVTVETVSRSLTDLKHRGSISLTHTRQVKIVDRAALTEMAMSTSIGIAE